MPRGARHPTSCNVNNEPFIHPAAVTWPSTARGGQGHRRSTAQQYLRARWMSALVGGLGIQRRDTWTLGWSRKLDRAPRVVSLLPEC